MKKIGIIADIHSNLNALDAVLNDMPKTDKIVCAGDLVGYGPQPNEVLDRMKSQNILSVTGNHDYAITKKNFEMLEEIGRKAAEWTFKELSEENLEYLRKLENKKVLNESGYEIFICHGTPRNPLKEYLSPSASNRTTLKMTQNVNSDVIILGHTHVPLNRTLQGKMIINPGSVGQPRDRNPNASYAILELSEKKEITQKRVEYDTKKTAEKIKEAGLPEKLSNRLHFGW
ncbi:MAG: metallophosphoesterase family protein [Candidatus Hadarchaeia archaeon]